MIKITNNHLKHLNIPEIHWKATLANIPGQCKHKKFISEYLENIVSNVQAPKGLLLFGDFGSGKSALAAIILKAALFKGYIGYWVRAFRLPEVQINKTLFDETTTMFDRLLQVPILVIDEVIIRTDIKYTEQILEQVIRFRTDDGLCTILTTNFIPDYFKENYPALYGVLQECVVPVKVTGHNFRQDIANKLVKL